VEAGEFLVMVLRQETGGAAPGGVRGALAHGQRGRVADLRQHHEIAMNPQVRETLGE